MRIKRMARKNKQHSGSQRAWVLVNEEQQLDLLIRFMGPMMLSKRMERRSTLGRR